MPVDVTPVLNVVASQVVQAIEHDENPHGLHTPTINAENGTMLKKAFPSLFPLHLAPIDSFYCIDDSEKYPMTSVIHMDFDGEMDEVAFRHALPDALYRHPLLSSLIQPVKRNMPCWVPTEEVSPRVDWGTWDEPIRCPGRESISLDREVGLRFWVRTDGERTRMTIQVHHACTDGTGVYRFLGDLLAFYGIQTAHPDERQPELGEVDPRLLRGRRMSMTNLMGRAAPPRIVLNGLKEAWNIFGQRIRTLCPPQRASDVARVEFPGIETVSLSKSEHAGLRAFASEHGAMMNDLLMAEMFRTIIRWNEREGRSGQNDRLRIMMPADLREVAHHEMPAANMTAYTFVTRRVRDCAHMPSLLRSMRDETLRIKRERSGGSFVDAIMLHEYSPQVMPYLLHSGRCIATTTLSNVGDPSKRFSATFPRQKGKVVCGNLVLEDVSGVPPLRENLFATLAVFSYCRKLTISVRCDPYRFDAEDTRRFAETYRDGLLSHLA